MDLNAEMHFNIVSAASERVGRSGGPTVRPSQAAARGAGESRSVGSPESGRAAWPVAERVGRSGTPWSPLGLAAERARRAGRSEILT